MTAVRGSRSARGTGPGPGRAAAGSASRPHASYVIKTAVPRVASRLSFVAQKTMYGGRRIAVGDTVYVFASENEGGAGLVARGTVTAASPTPRRRGVARQTPRVSVAIACTARAKRALGRAELKPFRDWDDGRPQSELNFKFYRQATDKIGGITDACARFLDGFFQASGISRDTR